LAPERDDRPGYPVTPELQLFATEAIFNPGRIEFLVIGWKGRKRLMPRYLSYLSALLACSVS
jgi:hypothetical protein